MTTQTTVVGTPMLPRVNLLPPEIAEARTLRQLRLGAGGAVVLAVVGVAGLYMHAHSGVAGAQASLHAATLKTGQLTTEQAGLKKQTQIKDTVASAQTTLATALAPQILWSHYLQDMSVALAGNYWFTTLTLNEGTGVAGATVAVGAAPGDPVPIGNFTAQGKAVTHQDVSFLLRALGKERGISNPVFTSSAEDAQVVTGTHTRLVTFTVQAAVTDTLKPQATAITSTPTGAPAAAGSTTAAAPAAGSTPTSTTTPAGH
jgi:Tfp pilus assembly protein PilN